MKFYLTLDCERCDAELYYGPVLTLLEHNNLPVVPTTLVEQKRVDCANCGTQHYLGEVDVYVEADDDESEDESEND